MANNAENILSLTSEEVTDYFMTSEQYCGFELPEYFIFDELLQSVREAIGDTPYEECLRKGVAPDELPDVNLDFLLNKDGRYAVRPIVIANPFLYYFLVRELCCERSWKIVKRLFAKFRVPHITSCALPVVPNPVEKFYKSTTILNWWNSLEQRSIELSLEYRYMFVSDITNCYGTIDPRTFDNVFAIVGKSKRSQAAQMSTGVQTLLRALQHGRNIGIPQGSELFDFLSEFVLGYSDLLLHESIQKEGIEAPYEILRYRDDYRVFCNDKDALEKISYLLQHVLESLNLRMNSGKTTISESLVTDSVKPDKLFYIYNTPILNKKGSDFDSFEKHLLYILMFARRYPNSGSVKKMLSELDTRIDEWLKSRMKRRRPIFRLDSDLKVIPAEEIEAPERQSLPGGSVRAMAAICVQIAVENVVCGHYALRVLSRIVDTLADKEEKRDIVDKVYARLCNLPNSDYNQLWLQNITYQRDNKSGHSPYDVPLCRMVMGEDVRLWNLDWLKPQLSEAVRFDTIVDREVLKEVKPVITFRESRNYNNPG